MVNTYLHLFRELQKEDDGKWLCCEPIDEETGLAKPFKLKTVREDFPMITGAGRFDMEDCIGDHVCCIGVSNESEPVRKYLDDHVRRYSRDGDVAIGTHVYYDRGALTLKQIREYLDKMDYLLELTGYMPDSLMADNSMDAEDLQHRFSCGCFEQDSEHKIQFYRQLMMNNPVRKFYNEIAESVIEGEALAYCKENYNSFYQHDSMYNFKGMENTAKIRDARVTFFYQDL